MKYEEVNESTIKINLSFQDLQDHDVKLSDFFGNQSLIEQLFYDLVEELDLGERFTQTGMLTFQVQPHPKGVYLVVREENMDFNPEDFPDDPEEIENMMGTLFEKIGNMAKQNGMSNPNDSLFGRPESEETENKQDQADFIYYSVAFDSISKLLLAAKNVKINEEQSELYSYEGNFYLVILDNQRDKGKTTVATNRARLMEYGTETSNSRELLFEHGKPLLKMNALKLLQGT